MRYYFLPLLFVTLICCKEQNASSEAPYEDPTNNTIDRLEDGEQLSKIYCAACHQYPEPSLLDRATWERFVLPRMGYMYGIYTHAAEREALFEANEGGARVRESGLFPEERRIDSVQWEAIQDYYLTNAPERLALPKRKPIHKSLTQFNLNIPNQKVKIPSTTMASFSSKGTIYLGDAHTKSFSVFSSQLSLLQTGTVQEGAVWLVESPTAYLLTVMGSFAPTDAPLGGIARLSKEAGQKSSVPIRNLQRPVHMDMADVNKDGKQDLVVCEFGKWTGALSLFLQAADGTFQKKVLHPVPGAIKSYFRDMNGDGHMDIVALFAQGNEGVDIFYNDGNANFTRKRILQFSPSFGGSFMKLIDYNNDGHLDILLTAGDNADYRPLMKPWHGVYLFLNQGNAQFEETLFLHLNGAYNAVAEDFDADGDIDIAAISFFPDWENTPEESFVYFENTPGGYEPQTFPEVTMGRWVVMDAFDYDFDGDVDLILGSLAFEVVPKLGFVEKWIKGGVPFVVLENTQNR